MKDQQRNCIKASTKMINLVQWNKKCVRGQVRPRLSSWNMEVLYGNGRVRLGLMRTYLREKWEFIAARTPGLLRFIQGANLRSTIWKHFLEIFNIPMKIGWPPIVLTHQIITHIITRLAKTSIYDYYTDLTGHNRFQWFYRLYEFRV